MCLGLPGRIVSLGEGADLGQVEIAGVVRTIDLSLLPERPDPGDYVLVHSGIALERMPPDQGRGAEAWFAASTPQAPEASTPQAPEASAPQAPGPLARDEGTEDE